MNATNSHCPAAATRNQNAAAACKTLSAKDALAAALADS
jgi:hypothetical protein